MGATKPVTDETFEAEVLRSTKTVPVDTLIALDGTSQSRQFQSYSTHNPDQRPT